MNDELTGFDIARYSFSLSELRLRGSTQIIVDDVSSPFVALIRFRFRVIESGMYSFSTILENDVYDQNSVRIELYNHNSANCCGPIHQTTLTATDTNSNLELQTGQDYQLDVYSTVSGTKSPTSIVSWNLLIADPIQHIRDILTQPGINFVNLY